MLYDVWESICQTDSYLSFIFTDAEYQAYPNGTCTGHSSSPRIQLCHKKDGCEDSVEPETCK